MIRRGPGAAVNASKDLQGTLPYLKNVEWASSNGWDGVESPSGRGEQTVDKSIPPLCFDTFTAVQE